MRLSLWQERKSFSFSFSRVICCITIIIQWIHCNYWTIGWLGEKSERRRKWAVIEKIIDFNKLLNLSSLCTECWFIEKILMKLLMVCWYDFRISFSPVHAARCGLITFIPTFDRIFHMRVYSQFSAITPLHPLKSRIIIINRRQFNLKMMIVMIRKIFIERYLNFMCG